MMKRVHAAVERAGRRMSAMTAEEREKFDREFRAAKLKRAADDARRRVSSYTDEQRQVLDKSARERMAAAKEKHRRK